MDSKDLDIAEKNAKARIAAFDFSKAKVLFTVPTSWDQWFNMKTADFVFRQTKKPFFYDFIPIASRNPEIGRNTFIDQAMNKDRDWTHIMFLDWDTYPFCIEDAMERLLSMDKDIAAGMYPVWLDNLPFWTVVTTDGEVLEEKKKHTDSPARLCGIGAKTVEEDTSFRIGHLVTSPFPFTEMTRVDRVGMGFSLVKRHVFEKVTAPYMQQLYKPDGSIRCTEDYYFCDKAARAGLEVWLDPMIMCGHSQRRDTLQDILVLTKMFQTSLDEERNGLEKERAEIRFVLEKMGIWDTFKKTYHEMRQDGVEGEIQDSAA